jgi:hypothetical protein
MSAFETKQICRERTAMSANDSERTSMPLYPDGDGKAAGWQGSVITQTAKNHAELCHHSNMVALGWRLLALHRMTDFEFLLVPQNHSPALSVWGNPSFN